MIGVLHQARLAGRRIFVFGNGGSAATASHFAQDLAKGAAPHVASARGRFRALSLTDNTPYLLALANDLGYETVFRQQLMTLAQPGDVAIGISGSGKSPNVLAAIRYAKEIDMVTVGLTGFDGGQLRSLVDYSVHVASMVMEAVEDAHMAVCHAIVCTLRSEDTAPGWDQP